MLSLENSYFFHGHNVAWETINQLKQGELPETLTEFLANSLPSGKGKKVELAI